MAIDLKSAGQDVTVINTPLDDSQHETEIDQIVDNTSNLMNRRTTKKVVKF